MTLEKNWPTGHKIDEVSQDFLKKHFDYVDEPGLPGRLRYKKIPMKSRHKLGDIAGYQKKNSNYRQMKIDGQEYLEHQLIWKWHYGDIPKGKIIDHFDGNHINNRIGNLRPVTYAESAKSLPLSDLSVTGYPGVTPAKGKPGFNSSIQVNGKKIKCGNGYYTSFDAAVEARKKAERKYGFSPTHGRTKKNVAEMREECRKNIGEDKLLIF